MGKVLLGTERCVVNRMSMDEKLTRINELYHKSQKEGLTEAEKEEQAQLRREYAASVRANLRGQLDNIVIEHPDGRLEKLSDRRRIWIQ